MNIAKLSTMLIFCKSADVQERLHIEATERYEADCENQKLENAADEAYKKYYNTCKSIATMLTEITDGQIDNATAFKMAFIKRAEIQKIFQ